MLPHDRSHLLILQNPWYASVVTKFFTNELKNDGKDITTSLLGKLANKNVSATITAKSSGILAGKEEAEWVLGKFFPKIQVTWKIPPSEFPPDRGGRGGEVHDGEPISSGQVLCTLTGKAKDILKAERPLLNMLMRMSGIATETKRLASISPIPLSATRKTLWGPLDKKAVSIGGGLTHRLGLFDAILLKENHLALMKSGVGELSKIFNTPSPASSTGKNKNVPAFFEVEVETEEEFWSVYNSSLPHQAGACPDFSGGSRRASPIVIMFDNFSPEAITKIVSQLPPKNVREKNGIFLEASGGISEKNLLEYGKTGVDVLSLSALTMKTETVDLSLRIDGGRRIN